MRRRQWPIAVVIVFGVVSASWPEAHSPLFVWNASRSVPVGLYVVIARAPLRGELAALRLAEPMRSLAAARRYLPANSVLIKPVAALTGDIICRRGAIVAINGCPVARALTADSSGRPLPEWSGCYGIDYQQVFVIADEPSSFDSRYLGPVDARQVIGTAVAVTVDSIAGAANSKR